MSREQHEGDICFLNKCYLLKGKGLVAKINIKSLAFNIKIKGFTIEINTKESNS